MIRYHLACSCNHEFDAWFSSSASFDTQEADRQILCPACGGADVRKALMAPRIANRQHEPARPDASTATPMGAPLPVPDSAARLVGEDAGRVRALMGELRQLRDRIMANSENVGQNFAEEARRIHYEEAPDRAIYGEASPQEVRQLDEEGIDVLPLPRLAEDLS